MKYEKSELTLEKGLNKEWIITNGIGGYSSSTILGTNTRKYHGLLVAPFSPPANRYLILSKIDESIEIDGKKHDLYTNLGKRFVSHGYRYLTSFEKGYIPIFTYNVEGIQIKKFICMEYGKNTVTVFYHIINQDKNAKFTVAPLLNFRDFHTVSNGHEFTINQNNKETKVRVILEKETKHPIYMNLSEGKYYPHEHDQFYNMYYIEEEKRGFMAEENHIVPGRYEVELEPHEEKCITFVCSLEENIEEIDARNIINKEIVRLSSLVYESDLLSIEKNQSEDPYYKELIKNYVISSDNFVVKRPTFGLHTIIAGYHWFLDWGRDTLIAFEGLVLITKRYEIAKEILLTMIRDVKYGLVPNGYSGYDNRPLYNSVDASLLLFEQIKKYITYTMDYQFIQTKFYDVLVQIIDSYCRGIDVDQNNIKLDEDGLISSGTSETQNTWMDAKVDGEPVTPRNGKTVEINSMWYNALKIMEELTTIFIGKEQAKKYQDLAKRCQKSFREKFYNKRRKCLYDVLGDSKIRPNQLFALSLSYPILDPASDIAKEMFTVVTNKLLTPYGLKTLAKGEQGYIECYEGDGKKRDGSYHQGIVWPWLLGIYFDSFQKIISAEKSKTKKKQLQEKYEEWITQIESNFMNFITKQAVGSIPEIYDAKKPYAAKGAFAQAWSVAEIFRIILKGKQTNENFRN